jgi:predicted nucleotidyltransferase
VDRTQIIQTLREHHAELRSMGGRRLDLFGSCARAESRPESDIDLLVEFETPVGLFHIARLQGRLSQMLSNRDVDLVPRSCVPAAKLESIQRDLLNAYSN